MTSACENITDRLYAYADRELTGVERGVVEAHLDACPSCRRRLADEVAFLGVLRARLAPHAAPGELRGELARSLDRADQRASGPRRTAGLAAIATVCVVRAGDRPAAAMAIDLIERHADEPLELGVTDPDAVARHMRIHIGVETTPPRFGAAARPERVWVTRAARSGRMLRLEYALSSRPNQTRRVVVYAFDQRRVRPAAERVRWIDGTAVRVRSARGYTMASYTRRGVGFAVVSSMAEDDLLDLIRRDLAAGEPRL